MALYADECGTGRSVIMVHGWGMHGGIWSAVTSRLASAFRVVAIDMPGHGHSAPARYTIDSLAAALVAHVREPAIWVGWSLGALAVMNIARLYPALVRKSVLVSATPRFVVDSDWPHAVEPEVWRGFRSDIETDYERTLSRFLALQFGVTAADRAGLRAVRAQMAERATPNPQALADGLDILYSSDLRSSLHAIAGPTFIVHGARDRLVPAAAAEFLAQHIPQARYHVIQGAGHAPFVSHFDEFMGPVEQFLLNDGG